jgi:hypothetical protein
MSARGNLDSRLSSCGSGRILRDTFHVLDRALIDARMKGSLAPIEECFLSYFLVHLSLPLRLLEKKKLVEKATGRNFSFQSYPLLVIDH